MMAKKLLALHMDENEAHKIDEIVDKLTSKLFYHGHPINRREAKEQVGLPTIENPSAAIEELMWSLYVDYEQEIKMEEPFQPAQEFIAQFPTLQPGSAQVTPIASAKLAFVESVKRTDVSSLDYELAGQMAGNGITQVTTIFRRQGWITE